MPQSLDEFLFIQAYYFAPEPISVKPSGGVARAIVAATVSPTSRPGYSMVLLLCGNSPGLFDQAKSDLYFTCNTREVLNAVVVVHMVLPHQLLHKARFG